ncbi:hypothetical protein PG984_014252 [Apiospora sp. TS-2023a]
MRDVQSAVTAALKDYETRAKSSKARKWLSSCFSRVKYYEAVFDTLAQHYPEFTSLAWGTFKFLFTAVLNHEELLTEISKAVSRIGDMLPRTELHSELYPTERMREAVALLYAQIIEFALMAVRWFKKGKIMHSVAAIQSRQNEILVDLRDQKQFFRNAQLEDVHQLMLEQGTPDSESSLAFCRSMRTRRTQKLATQLPATSIPTLKDWIDEPTSSLLLAESRGIRTSPLDFAIEFLNAVLDRGYPIIWALPFLTESFQSSDEAAVTTTPSPPQPLSVAGLLRSLVLQTLHLSSAVMTEGRNPVTIRHLRGTVAIEQWFNILERCVSTLPALFIVIDIGILEAAIGRGSGDEDDPSGDRECYRVSDFIDRMSELVSRRHRQGRLKVVIAATKCLGTCVFPRTVVGKSVG